MCYDYIKVRSINQEYVNMFTSINRSFNRLALSARRNLAYIVVGVMSVSLCAMLALIALIAYLQANSLTLTLTLGR